ncbi:MAG: alpha/beta hydrolase family protein [Agriterribacter sp.]
MSKRRQFLKLAALTGLGSGSLVNALSFSTGSACNSLLQKNSFTMLPDEESLSLIGLYGSWAAGLIEKKLPRISYRRDEWNDLSSWKKAAKQHVLDRLSVPDIKTPDSKILKRYEYDGLKIEELQWQLPYGRPTDAIVLKPTNVKGKLPAILAFHDHGGNKYFGTRKITKTADQQHPLAVEHQKEYYEGMAWANEVAKRGYVVMVSDAFPFASRRVMLQDVPQRQRGGLNDNDPEAPVNIEAYNKWAGEHEHIMAKSLFCAGTTWPAVFWAEDRIALDILCARNDVDAQRVGCAGLSGGGMRTVFMGGLDDRIKCAVCVGFMTTWKDFMLYKSFTHTWMTYVPLLPNELDFPEILGLRIPLPTLVLNNNEDQLFTLPEMKRADTILQQLYKKSGTSDKYRCSYYDGLHKFDRPMQQEAFEWFDKWLK